MKKNSPEKSGIHEKPRRELVRGMSMANLAKLMAVLEAEHGESAKELTMVEVMEKYPHLVSQLDGERNIGTGEISDETMREVEYRLEMGTTIRDARRGVAEKAVKGKTKVA